VDVWRQVTDLRFQISDLKSQKIADSRLQARHVLRSNPQSALTDLQPSEI